MPTLSRTPVRRLTCRCASLTTRFRRSGTDRRVLVRMALLAAACGPLSIAQAQAQAQSQEYPVRPVRLVVPQAAGSSTDIVARMLAEALSTRFGQQVLVDPRPGAGGSIGAALVAKAPADGYTLLMANSGPLAINASIYRTLPYKPAEDFAAVARVAVGPYVLLVHPSLPAASVADLLRLARSRPRELVYASGGNGTGTHLSGELLQQLAGVRLLHVPYRGSAPGLTDLVTGQVSLMFIGLPPAIPHVMARRVRALAVTSSERSPALAAVPTLQETGVKGYDVSLWLGLVAPAGTPAGIVRKLNDGVRAMEATPQVRERMTALGLEAGRSGPDAFAGFIRAEIRRWADVVRRADIESR